MNFIITLLLLLFILGFIVLIHELGHFVASKKIGVYVDEFAVGMGPKIFKFKRKNDETEYTIRAFPIGGFVAMANAEDEEYPVGKERVLENKKIYQKIAVLIMGVIFNFILAFVLLFFNGLIFGSPETKPYIGQIMKDSAAFKGGLREKDLIKSVNDVKVTSGDDVLLELTVKKDKNEYKFVVERAGKNFTTTLEPTIEKDEDGNDKKIFGFNFTAEKKYGFINAVKYASDSTYKLTKSIFNILGKLITGKVGLNNLSGPVGVYSVVDNLKEKGIETIIYLIAYLSINVGVINLLPIPVFDGGRILLVIIEKIKGKKLHPNVELYLSYLGFGFMILLFILVTFNDIIRLL